MVQQALLQNIIMKTKVGKKALGMHSSFEEKEYVDLIPERRHMCFRHFDQYWIYTAEQLCPKSSSLSTIYDIFISKVLKVVI